MLTSAGAKLLDFGLVKLRPQPAAVLKASSSGEIRRAIANFIAVSSEQPAATSPAVTGDALRHGCTF